MIIKPLLIGAIEQALNLYLSLDEDSSVFLAPLEGKVIAVNVLPLNWVFYICPGTENIQLLENCTQPPDTTMSGSIAAFGLMGLSSSPMQSVFSGEVTIEGDIETGKKFQYLFEKLDIDLEEHVSRYTGDVVAHQLGQIFRAGQKWTTDSIKTFNLNLSEYLHDETRELPSQPELDIFYRNVDQTRADMDRLSVRIDRLNKAYSEKNQ